MPRQHPFFSYPPLAKAQPALTHCRHPFHPPTAHTGFRLSAVTRTFLPTPESAGGTSSISSPSTSAMHRKSSPKSLSESCRHSLLTTAPPAEKTVSTLENPKVLRDFSKVLTVFSHPNSAWEGECLAAVRRWSSCFLLRHSACSALQLRRRQCLMGDNRGNILRRRTMYAGMRPPTITRVTAEIISAMP